LNPGDPARFPDDWNDRTSAWRKREHVLELAIHRGFFLSTGARDWRRFMEVIYMLRDAPDVVREMMAIYAEFCARLADSVLDQVDVDFVSFSEPIGGNEGPLLSPRQYERFVLESYRPILDIVRKHGVGVICFTTYANVRPLIPSVLEAGFNCLWAYEVNMEAMDYRRLRAEFGRGLRLIGGIDLDTILLGKTAMRREIMSRVPPLLADGGYIPLADGRVRVNVPFENYAYYRRLIEEVSRR